MDNLSISLDVMQPRPTALMLYNVFEFEISCDSYENGFVAVQSARRYDSGFSAGHLRESNPTRPVLCCLISINSGQDSGRSWLQCRLNV